MEGNIEKLIVVHVGDVLKCPPALNVLRLSVAAGLETSLVTTPDHEMGEYALSIPDKVKTIVIGASYRAAGSMLSKALGLKKTKRMLLDAIDDEYDDKGSIVWIVSDLTIKHLGDSVKRYRYVLHIMELTEELYYSKKIKTLKLDASDLGNKALAVVVPNESRAYITQAWWKLETLPLVLPNKPVGSIEMPRNADIANEECRGLVASLSEKKIILYQGITHKERPLLPFFEAVRILGDPYVFATMGASDPLPWINDEQYVHFPFVQPPEHLEITSHAYIGVLSYFPVEAQYSILNAVFCAPNKSFEYSRFGVPMISNDNFELNLIFEKYDCGISVKAFKPNEIAAAIKRVDESYSTYSAGAMNYFRSVNMNETFTDVLDAISIKLAAGVF